MRDMWTLNSTTELDLRAALILTAPTILFRYECSCPAFQKKGVCIRVCKHAIGYGLFKKQVSVPLRFSVATCGKRKVPAGASLSKRTKCLEIDE